MSKKLKETRRFMLSTLELCFEESFGIYGTRRIKKFLEKEYGQIVSRRRVAKTMGSLNIKARNKKRFNIVTTDSRHNF